MADRHCGECTLCCKLLPVKELEKGADTRCQHQGRKGCAIYHQLGFPGSCGLWNCAWLGGEDVPRPDRCGWVVDIVPDMVYAQNNETGEQQQILVSVVWVEPGRDPTFDPKLRRYAERCAEKNMAVMLRFGSHRAVIVFPPALASDGKWHFVRDGTNTESGSGNLLIDSLKAEREARDAEGHGDIARGEEGADDRAVVRQSEGVQTASA